MLVLPLGQPGLPAEADATADPSEAGGADFAALMAAMAAMALNPPPAPSPAPGTDGTSPAGDGASLPTGAAALPPAFGSAAGGASPMLAPTPAVPAAPPAQPDALPAPAPTPVAGSPAVESVEPAPEAATPPPPISGPRTGQTGNTTRADLSPPPSGDAQVEAAAVPATGQRSLDRTETAGEPGTDEGPGSKPVAVTGPAHDRFSTPPAHAGGALLATAVGGTAEAPAHSTPVQHPPVVEQVVSVVEPLRHRGDGHHELTLDLRPAELGPIRVEVSIDRGTVHLSLHAEQASTGTLLDQALPELRAALEEAGLVAGRLGVGSGDREGGRPPAESRPAEGDEPKAARPAIAAAVAPVRPPAVPAAGALDLLL